MSKHASYLSDDEIREFVDCFDNNAVGGQAHRSELEQCLEQTHSELAMPSKKTFADDQDAHVRRQAFRDLLGETGPLIPLEYLVQRIRSWKVPSLMQVRKQEKRQDGDLQRRGVLRLAYAYWAVHGYEIVFLGFVVATIVASAVAESVRYGARRYTSAPLGTFVQGSDPSNGEAVTRVVAQKIPGHDYMDYIRSRAGFKGIAALSLFYIVAILISIFGYLLALPTFLLLFERISRISLGFYLADASVEVLTSDTIEVTAELPDYRIWEYTAGQYILLLVPDISLLQWHPFTIAFCRDKMITLHIKTGGDWTAQLRHLGPSIKVAINGPFGAPAQRFGDFRYSLIIGAGVGITPFSAILADLQRKDDLHIRRQHRQQLDCGGNCQYAHETVLPLPHKSPYQDARHRRTDFHWNVRDRHNLSWLSGLLNRVSMSQRKHRDLQQKSPLDIRINTHITANYTCIVPYVFSWILEISRSDQHPASSLTGLLNATYFGRPDFNMILDEHYDDMRNMIASRNMLDPVRICDEEMGRGHDRERDVGVFYCGASEVGVLLADKCWRLTNRGQTDGNRIEYHFIVETF
ncbi:FAD-binding 8 [Cordyceps fumosorosea ARSEF 2679]|uniref:FAD-binding 8 n=1 Tax=Cordyceps fumosorosea (strain ARSEF 2679) TaxID=1081104 RepID=A0A167CVD1_CORFA|nr:FAD-binding 8 [Cordyceps fumosorosea ARSEF 2679]OAA41621.1 FAD-binding 8 [Cordyceps fumosorosea ARSEF 2679]